MAEKGNPGGYSGDERRTGPRLLLGLSVNFISAEAEAKNVSDGGMCITASEKYVAGQIADIMFFLPDHQAIKAQGRIVWSRKIGIDLYDYGIEFIDLEKKHIDFLQAYISRGGV